MKKIKILLAVWVLAIVSSCSDSFLDSKELVRKTDENYYANPEDCYEALVGCYDALQLIWAEGVALPVAATVKGDLAFGGTGAGDGENYRMLDEHDKSVSVSDLNVFDGNWINYYKGIFRCNKLINRMGQADWSTAPEMEKQIMAEARFLRAFFYFDMVRMFENIPLLTIESSDIIAPSKPDDVYLLIAEDLLYAVENGSSITYQQILPTDHGHANKWAAKSLLARVYMYYTGYYNKENLLGLVSKTDALNYLENVIAESGYGLVDSYYQLWPAASTYKAVKDGNTILDTEYAGETNKEVVFAIKYTYTSDYNGNTDGNHWMVMNGIRNAPVAKYGYGSGWGASTVAADFYKEWDPKDTRRDASILAIAEEKINYGQIKDVKEYTGYFTKKYVPQCDETGKSTAENLGGGNFMIGQYQDYFSIRFADVLLMAAELGSANALDYVNQVRRRAGVDEVASVTKDVIFEERKHEFAFEGLRYWDLLRYDHTLEYAASNLEKYNGTVLTGNIPVEKVIDGNNIKLTRGLFQIPYNQITFSGGVLIQNKGWE
jgi:starch-binding outer membrane protein, SusD/RagB family